jgi:hypothetical protein
MSFRPESYKIVLMLFYSISRPLNHLHNTHTYKRIKTYALCASITLQNSGAALWMVLMQYLRLTMPIDRQMNL